MLQVTQPRLSLAETAFKIMCSVAFFPQIKSNWELISVYTALSYMSQATLLNNLSVKLCKSEFKFPQMSIYVVYTCFPNFYCERYRIGYICRRQSCRILTESVPRSVDRFF